MPGSPPLRIVVGYDGSPASRAAVAQAAHRAGDDGRVYVVHAVSLPTDLLATPSFQRRMAIESDGAHALVAGLEEEVGADLYGVEWSVAHELIHLAECPVTVIPERAVERAEERAKTLAA